jgi:hypothetical protein
MTTPYRVPAPPAHALAAAAALPPDAYVPEGRWQMVGWRLLKSLGALALIAVVAVALRLRWVGVAAVVGWYGVLIAQAVGRRKLAFELTRANDEALAKLRGGEVDEAGRALDRLAVRARGLGFFHALIVFNRGAVRLSQGCPEDALSLWDAVARSGWFDRYRALGYDLALAAATATAHGLIGDVSAAERALARAEACVGSGSRGRLLVAQSVLGLRRGDDRAVAARIDAEWAAAEGALPASGLRELRALQAWALLRAGAEEAEVQRAIERARPVFAGEHRYLGARWPELDEFIRGRIEA